MKAKIIFSKEKIILKDIGPADSHYEPAELIVEEGNFIEDSVRSGEIVPAHKKSYSIKVQEVKDNAVSLATNGLSKVAGRVMIKNGKFEVFVSKFAKIPRGWMGDEKKKANNLIWEVKLGESVILREPGFAYDSISPRLVILLEEIIK